MSIPAQGQRPNPLSPEQMKRRVRERIAVEIAEKLYQADKASPMAKLTDLAKELQGTYLSQGVQAVFGPMQNARITMIQVEQAHADGGPVDRRRPDGALDGDGRF